MAAGESSRVRKAKLAINNDGGLYETLQRFWQTSYAGDYLGLIVLVTAYLVLKLVGEPFHHMFRLDDARIQYPHAEVERVPVTWLMVYAGALPLAILVLWTAITRPTVHKAHVTLLGLVVSILLTTVLTDIIKDAVGRPRPDLLARCKPASTAPLHELVTVQICTQTDHRTLHDGWRSFPSGHSSFSFAGLGYLSFFLASQAHAVTPRASLCMVLLSLAPLLGAALIAMSRLEDYRHDVGDVVCGSVLGFLVAYFNWRRYYPSLLGKGCEEPHSLPGSRRGSPDRNGGGFSRARDEEEGFGDRRFSVGDDGER